MNEFKKRDADQLPKEGETKQSVSTSPAVQTSTESIPAASSAQSEIPVEVDLNDVSEAALHFQKRLDYVATSIECERLVAENSREYQYIVALFQEASNCPHESLSHIRRTLLQFIDSHWDVYHKRFSIPDRLVNFKFTCKEGVHYLSLNRGYLCFYQNPFVKYPVAMPLVWPPVDHLDQIN